MNKEIKRPMGLSLNPEPGRAKQLSIPSSNRNLETGFTTDPLEFPGPGHSLFIFGAPGVYEPDSSRVLASELKGENKFQPIRIFGNNDFMGWFKFYEIKFENFLYLDETPGQTYFPVASEKFIQYPNGPVL